MKREFRLLGCAESMAPDEHRKVTQTAPEIISALKAPLFSNSNRELLEAVGFARRQRRAPRPIGAGDVR